MNAAQALQQAADRNYQGENYRSRMVKFRDVVIGVWITDTHGLCRYYPRRAHG
jgi:hypothetical protein